ncbi:wiskott-Aldrich syndrome protein homolog 1-like [Eucalyptus grandis]|uniref:wiskott-Aldrich syndrome protein homolog 1-like n=1 Tax=Eucalyptus grandis TaxID=71139 RepID=UPI00192F0179|nr:wiskott-Aldrich syndrome protein homolog 1-like [Eucalyptus grandis]
MFIFLPGPPLLALEPRASTVDCAGSASASYLRVFAAAAPPPLLPPDARSHDDSSNALAQLAICPGGVSRRLRLAATPPLSRSTHSRAQTTVDLSRSLLHCRASPAPARASSAVRAASPPVSTDTQQHYRSSTPPTAAAGPPRPPSLHPLGARSAALDCQSRPRLVFNPRPSKSRDGPPRPRYCCTPDHPSTSSAPSLEYSFVPIRDARTRIQR